MGTNLTTMETLEKDVNLLHIQYQKTSEKINQLQTHPLDTAGISSELSKELDYLKKLHLMVTEDKDRVKVNLENAAKLEKQIKTIQSSPYFMPEFEIDMGRQIILKMEEKIRVASYWAKEIENIEKQDSYLHPIKVEAAQKVVKSAETLLKEIKMPKIVSAEIDTVLKVHEDARIELECSICLVIPRPPNQVLSCQEHHLICNQCFQRRITKCPVCRQDFIGKPPTINRLAEKMIAQLC